MAVIGDLRRQGDVARSGLPCAALYCGVTPRAVRFDAVRLDLRAVGAVHEAQARARFRCDCSGSRLLAVLGQDAGENQQEGADPLPGTKPPCDNAVAMADLPPAAVVSAATPVGVSGPAAPPAPSAARTAEAAARTAAGADVEQFGTGYRRGLALAVQTAQLP